MRTVAAVVGGAGAALGALYYFSAIVVWVAIVLLSGLWPTTLVDLAFVGPLAAAGVPEGLRADTGPPPGSYFRAALGPVVPLLAGAALAFVVARRSARP